MNVETREVWKRGVRWILRDAGRTVAKGWAQDDGECKSITSTFGKYTSEVDDAVRAELGWKTGEVARPGIWVAHELEDLPTPEEE